MMAPANFAGSYELLHVDKLWELSRRDRLTRGRCARVVNAALTDKKLYLSYAAVLCGISLRARRLPSLSETVLEIKVSVTDYPKK